MRVVCKWNTYLLYLWILYPGPPIKEVIVAGIFLEHALFSETTLGSILQEHDSDLVTAFSPPDRIYWVNFRQAGIKAFEKATASLILHKGPINANIMTKQWTGQSTSLRWEPLTVMKIISRGYLTLYIKRTKFRPIRWGWLYI